MGACVFKNDSDLHDSTPQVVPVKQKVPAGSSNDDKDKQKMQDTMKVLSFSCG